MDIGNKNKAECLKIIKEIELAIQFHGNKWNAEGWKRFLQRKENQMDFFTKS